MSFLEIMEPLIHWIVFTKLILGTRVEIDWCCVLGYGGWGGRQVILAGIQIKAPKNQGPMLKVPEYLGWENCGGLQAKQKERSLEE